MLDVLLFLVLGTLLFTAVFTAMALLTPERRRVYATYASGLRATAVIKQRRFPWPSDNVVFWSTIFEGGNTDGISNEILKHELVHVQQYLVRGWFWVWTHPKEREAEAHLAEGTPYPQWVDLP